MLRVKERDIQAACEQFLGWDGWRIWHPEQNWSEKKRKTVGEAGAPDCHAVRYLVPPSSETVYIEWKSKSGVHGVKQIAWRMAERARGALVWVAKEDFEADFDSFLQFYRASGLLRRQGL